MIVYYDSKTGNVNRFVDKIKNLVNEIQFIKIENDVDYTEKGHLITYTTKIGQVPDKTKIFLESNHKLIETISSSGNMNWGNSFGLALDKIHEMYNIRKGIKFELSGNTDDIKKYIIEILNLKINEFY